MKHRLAALASIGLLVAGAATAKAIGREGHAMSTTETNRAIVADFARLFYTERDVRAAFEKYVASDYIQHNPNLPDGRAAAIGMLGKLFGGPGASFDVKRIIVDGDLALIHLHGRPDPAGKGVAVADIYRLKDGKIVEHWDVLQPVPDTAVSAHPLF